MYIKKECEKFFKNGISLLEFGETVSPYGFLFLPKQVYITNLNFTTPLHKMASLDLLVKKAHKENALAIAVICEAWVSVVPLGTKEENMIRPSKDPQRKECLILALREVNGNTDTLMGEIITLGEDQRKTLGEGQRKTVKDWRCFVENDSMNVRLNFIPAWSH